MGGGDPWITLPPRYLHCVHTMYKPVDILALAIMLPRFSLPAAPPWRSRDLFFASLPGRGAEACARRGYARRAVRPPLRLRPHGPQLLRCGRPGAPVAASAGTRMRLRPHEELSGTVGDRVRRSCSSRHPDAAPTARDALQARCVSTHPGQSIIGTTWCGANLLKIETHHRLALRATC